MGKFKVGDRVRALVDWCDLKAGQEYVVAEVDESGSYVADGDGYDWFMTDNEIELVEPKWEPKVGDRVRCIESTAIIAAGKIYEVVDGTVYPPNTFCVYTGDQHGILDYNAAYFEPLPVVAVAASNDNAATAKFKVGDVVGDKDSADGTRAIVRGVKGERIDIEWLDGRGKPYGVFGDWPADGFDLITTTQPTAIVALIENGQPKPSDRPFVHATVESAEKEAERLAGLHKGQDFGVYVLTTTQRVAAPTYAHEWQTLAMKGQKIEAIKAIRRLTGMTLKGAKDAVEHWIDVGEPHSRIAA